MENFEQKIKTFFNDEEIIQLTLKAYKENKELIGKKLKEVNIVDSSSSDKVISICVHESHLPDPDCSIGLTWEGVLIPLKPVGTVEVYQHIPIEGCGLYVGFHVGEINVLSKGEVVTRIKGNYPQDDLSFTLLKDGAIATVCQKEFDEVRLNTSVYIKGKQTSEPVAEYWYI